MVLTGTIVNAAAIVLGSLLGASFKGMREETGRTVMQGIGMAVIVLGISMGMKSEQFLIVIFSLVLGAILGEWWKIEDKLNRLGSWLEKSISGKGEGRMATAFVTATLVYCVGSMAILGSLDSGLRNDHQILYTKAMLDGFSSIIFASTLGIGVIFSAFPVLIYQGIIALSASGISRLIEPELLNLIINELTATGGILIVGIGINLLGIKSIRVANLLPSLLVAAVVVPLNHWLSSFLS